MDRKAEALRKLKNLKREIVFLSLFLVLLIEVYYYLKGVALIEDLIDFGIALTVILIVTEFAFKRIIAYQSEALQKEISLKQLLASLNKLTPTTPVTEAMEICVKKATEAVSGDAGCIGTFDRKTNKIVYLYIYNLPKSLTQYLSLKDGVTSQVIREERGVIVNDYPNHPRKIKEFVEAGVKTVVAAPIVSREGCLGILEIIKFKKEPFTENDLEIVQAVANLNAFFLENARFFEKWQNEAQQKEHVARRALIDIENERKLLAAEIHDTILQGLVALKQRMLIAKNRSKDEDEKKRLNELSNLTQEVIMTARSLLSRTTVPLLEDLGLKHAIQALADSMLKNGLPKVEMEIGELPELDYLKEVNIFRIVQEALRNVQQHSQAKNVFLKLKKVNDHIELFIKDDGKGFNFDPKSFIFKNHLGLLLMRERAQLTGGEIEIKSQPGEGTKIKVLIPLK
jgi:signal transduction histidine kinase